MSNPPDAIAGVMPAPGFQYDRMLKYTPSPTLYTGRLNDTASGMMTNQEKSVPEVSSIAVLKRMNHPIANCMGNIPKPMCVLVMLSAA